MRTMENKMISQSDLDAMLNMGSVGEAVKFLADRNYGVGERTGNEGKKEIDEMLKAELEDAWQEIREACPKGAPIDVLLYQNDFQNAKTVLKAVFSGADWERLVIHPCTVEPRSIYMAVSEKDFDELPVLLREPVMAAYELLARTNDGQRAEIILDKAAFAAMRRMSEAYKNKFLLGWVELWAILTNMKTALRGVRDKRDRKYLQEAFLDTSDLNMDRLLDAAAQDMAAVLGAFAENGYEEAVEAAGKSFSEFEKWADNMLMDYVKSAQYASFGFEPLVAFLFGKKAELQALRIVLYGLLNQVPKNTLKERLREMYV
jgi:V/A-type H+-transporting ATPase subunit C